MGRSKVNRVFCTEATVSRVFCVEAGPWWVGCSTVGQVHSWWVVPLWGMSTVRRVFRGGAGPWWVGCSAVGQVHGEWGVPPWGTPTVSRVFHGGWGPPWVGCSTLWQVPPHTFFFGFFSCCIFGIGATIRTCQEIHCFPCAEVFFYHIFEISLIRFTLSCVRVTSWFCAQV